MTSDHDDGRGVSRRRILECMTWAGTGVLWTLAGGVPQSIGIIGEATAAEPSGLTFLQISDSHVGFDKAANPNAIGTLEEAINRIQSMPIKPSFIIHTGDITHLSKPSEFDDADRIISQARLDVHYVPGEHDFLDEDVKLYRDRYGRGTKGNGWYSFDANGALQVKDPRHQRPLLVHVHDARHLRLFLFPASAHDGNGRGRGGDRGQRAAVMFG